MVPNLPPMQFWTTVPGILRWPPPGPDGDWRTALGPEDFRTVVRAAEDLGFDTVTFSDHVLIPRTSVASMGGHWPDPLTAMAFVVGTTERIRVDTSVLVLPLHEPVALAKAVATLDVLSGGRVSLTVGLGALKGEFAALGVPFAERGRRADEHLLVMKELWTSDAPSFDGEFTSFTDVVFEPRPVQRPHPPVFVGGRSIHALRRAARLGDGWAPAGATGGTGPWLDGVDDLPRFLDEARRIEGFAEKEHRFGIHMTPAPVNLGADHRPIGGSVRFSSTAEVVDAIGVLRDAGVTGTMVPPVGDEPASLGAHLEHLAWASEEVLPHFR